MFKSCLIGLLLAASLEATPIDSLQKTVEQLDAPFGYDLSVRVLKGKENDEDVMLLLHGMGSNNGIADILRTYTEIPDHLVSFNFPDASIRDGHYDPRRTTFGTLQEILPALFMMKKLVVDGGVKKLNVYGFSAGGGALVNLVGILNINAYDNQLAAVGITKEDKVKILDALQNGVIILDAPLKSVREIIAARGNDPSMVALAQRYGVNQFEPIDALQNWKGLGMHVIVYFEVPDEVLSNRDDALFGQRLKTFNDKGTVQVLHGSHGGHVSYHAELWKAFTSSS